MARTSTTCTSGWVVGKISLRDFSGSSRTSMPAAASRGRVSSKMRPLERARVIMVFLSMEALSLLVLNGISH
ncbi:hypothetical protein D3C72_2034940 [compost metagenome]